MPRPNETDRCRAVGMIEAGDVARQFAVLCLKLCFLLFFSIDSNVWSVFYKKKTTETALVVL